MSSTDRVISINYRTEARDLNILSCVHNFHEEIDENLSNYKIWPTSSLKEFEGVLFNLPIAKLPDVLLIEVENAQSTFELVKKIKNNILLRGIIIILLADEYKKEVMAKAKASKVHDIYFLPINYNHLVERIEFLVRFKLIKPNILNLDQDKLKLKFKLPLWKRAFDIFFAVSLIILLLPIMLIVGILVKIESKGSIFYISKRVGTGYKIFDFYKFRSMKEGADSQLKDLEIHNQYSDDGANAKVEFVKLKNDPRVTPLGKILRNSSIDEFPQLFNILRGDMCVVGNRPLPLYEAEMLTSNDWAQRFLAPAGLTGLWQISKRGKGDMSARERKKLDNFYALKFSFCFDMKILFNTIPAVFQKEKV